MEEVVEKEEVVSGKVDREEEEEVDKEVGRRRR